MEKNCSDCTRRKFYMDGYEAGRRDSQRWIPCSERMPEEGVNPITRDWYIYLVSVSFGNGIVDIRHYKFGKGHWWHGDAIMDKYVLAWMPLPEPYREEGEQ